MNIDEFVVGQDAKDCGIQKKLLFAGTKKIDLVDGSKIYFHYKTIRVSDNIVVDDSKQYDRPMELILGKKFKLEVWETCLKTMWLNEVSEFKVNKQLVLNYASCAKQLRDYYKKQSHSHEQSQSNSKSCCGYSALKDGLGYPDLDELFKAPQDLIFILEIVKIELPNEYDKESWILNDKERLELVPKLKEEGNVYFNQKDYENAISRYQEALAHLDILMNKEKPNDTEWNYLNNKKIILLLNLVQCKLFTREYYVVVEHTNYILNYDRNNLKALLRRAKAHKFLHSYEEARKDLSRLLELDDNNKNLYLNELKDVEILEKTQIAKEKNLFKGKLFN